MLTAIHRRRRGGSLNPLAAGTGGQLEVAERWPSGPPALSQRTRFGVPITIITGRSRGIIYIPMPTQPSKRSRLEKSVVKSLYEQGSSLRAIAEQFGVTPVAVMNCLHRQGIAMRRSGRPRLTPETETTCGFCQKPLRNRKYCDQVCYQRKVSNPLYYQWRHGQRHARAAVAAAGFALQPGHIVHHVDNDNRNNSLSNLWVFASHGDHMRFHRLGYIQAGSEPLWRGDGG